MITGIRDFVPRPKCMIERFLRWNRMFDYGIQLKRGQKDLAMCLILGYVIPILVACTSLGYLFFAFDIVHLLSLIVQTIMVIFNTLIIIIKGAVEWDKKWLKENITTNIDIDRETC